MAKGIEQGIWWDETWNPITGCSRISEGCEHCWAQAQAKRFGKAWGLPADDPFKVTFHPNRLQQPLHWRKRRRVFVCDMGDLFHEAVAEDWISELFSIMATARRHTYFVLTKRPERLLKYAHDATVDTGEGYPNEGNVWLGVTAENQEWLEKRVPILLQIPAAVRFVCLEPLLGAVSGVPRLPGYLTALDWVIAGGETGPKARPTNPEWVRSVRDQCVDAGVPFFFKSWGEWIPAEQITQTGAFKPLPITGHVRRRHVYTAHRRLLDGRQWNEMPRGGLT